jgi:hypothetical protein
MVGIGMSIGMSIGLSIGIKPGKASDPGPQGARCWIKKPCPYSVVLKRFL